jgi:hypothetical protein
MYIVQYGTILLLLRRVFTRLAANLAQFHHYFGCKDTDVDNYYLGSNYRLTYF